jgi:hypothetical protein
LEEVFRLYHQDLLAKVLGKEHWDGWLRNYNTISGAKQKLSDEEEDCVGPGTEAFLVCLFDNCEDKWDMIAENKKAGKKTDKKRRDRRWKTKFIDQDAGVARWGGWNKDGRKAVRDLAKLVLEARKGNHVKGLEKACLNRVQMDQGIEVEEDDPKNKKRKAQNEPEEDDSDDELDCL